MSDDAKPLKRKPTEKQLAALRAGRLSPKKPLGRVKRMGKAYRPEVRTKARKEALAAQEARRQAKLLRGTGLTPPAPPKLGTFSDGGAALAKDIDRYQTEPIPDGLGGISAADLALVPEEAEDPRSRIRYSRMVADAVCQRIAEGQPIQDICAIEGMPTAQQVLAWARTRPEFKVLYEEALALQAEFVANRMLKLAQEALDNPKNAAAIRVAADILAKSAEWRAPRRFGPKMELSVHETPKTPAEILAEAKRLQEELGVEQDKRIH